VQEFERVWQHASGQRGGGWGQLKSVYTALQSVPAATPLTLPLAGDLVLRHGLSRYPEAILVELANDKELSRIAHILDGKSTSSRGRCTCTACMASRRARGLR